MDIISETFKPVTAELDVSNEYYDITLLRSTSNSNLYIAHKAGKRFIIKTPGNNSGLALAMLKREYELSTHLSHPHIANVYTYDAHTPMGAGIVMEYVDGKNLTEYLASNPSSNARQRVFTQLLETVAYIHQSGIIHNDLKPENIIISNANNDVKLIDFGLSDDDVHYLTRTLGCTTAYASPELLSQSSNIDTRSDIYSLGRILQEIYPNRYQRFVNRCLKLNKEERYNNAEELLYAWNRRKYPFYYLFAIVISALIIAPTILFINSFSAQKTSEAKLNILLDSLQLAQIKTNQVQAQFDSIKEIQIYHENEKQRRQFIQDSLCNYIDLELNQFYNSTLKTLKKAHFIEFATRDFVQLSNNAKKSFYDKISKKAPDIEMQVFLESIFDNKWVKCYYKIFDEINKMPKINSINDNEELAFYYNLLNNNMPYRPYVSNK